MIDCENLVSLFLEQQWYRGSEIVNAQEATPVGKPQHKRSHAIASPEPCYSVGARK